MCDRCFRENIDGYFPEPFPENEEREERFFIFPPAVFYALEYAGRF